MAWVGKGLKGHLVPTLCRDQGHLALHMLIIFNMLICGQFSGISQTFQVGSKKANISFHPACLCAFMVSFESAVQ